MSLCLNQCNYNYSPAGEIRVHADFVTNTLTLALIHVYSVKSHKCDTGKSWWNWKKKNIYLQQPKLCFPHKTLNYNVLDLSRPGKCFVVFLPLFLESLLFLFLKSSIQTILNFPSLTLHIVPLCVSVSRNLPSKSFSCSQIPSHIVVLKLPASIPQPDPDWHLGFDPASIEQTLFLPPLCIFRVLRLRSWHDSFFFFF